MCDTWTKLPDTNSLTLSLTDLWQTDKVAKHKPVNLVLYGCVINGQCCKTQTGQPCPLWMYDKWTKLPDTNSSTLSFTDVWQTDKITRHKPVNLVLYRYVTYAHANKTDIFIDAPTWHFEPMPSRLTGMPGGTWNDWRTERQTDVLKKWPYHWHIWVINSPNSSICSLDSSWFHQEYKWRVQVVDRKHPCTRET